LTAALDKAKIEWIVGLLLSGWYDTRQISKLTGVSTGKISEIWADMISRNPEIRDYVLLVKKVNKITESSVPQIIRAISVDEGLVEASLGVKDVQLATGIAKVYGDDTSEVLECAQRMMIWETQTGMRFDEAISRAKSAQKTLTDIETKEKDVEVREKRVAADERRLDRLIPEMVRVERLDETLAKKGGMESLEALVDLIDIGFSSQVAVALDEEAMKLEMSPEEASKLLLQILKEYPSLTQAKASIQNQIQVLQGNVDHFTDQAQKAEVRKNGIIKETEDLGEAFQDRKAEIENEIAREEEALAELKRRKIRRRQACQDLQNRAMDMKEDITFVNALMSLIRGFMIPDPMDQWIISSRLQSAMTLQKAGNPRGSLVHLRESIQIILKGPAQLICQNMIHPDVHQALIKQCEEMRSKIKALEAVQSPKTQVAVPIESNEQKEPHIYRPFQLSPQGFIPMRQYNGSKSMSGYSDSG
jgi:hypothetical protein